MVRKNINDLLDSVRNKINIITHSHLHENDIKTILECSSAEIQLALDLINKNKGLN